MSESEVLQKVFSLTSGVPCAPCHKTFHFSSSRHIKGCHFAFVKNTCEAVKDPVKVIPKLLECSKNVISQDEMCDTHN